MASDRTAIVPWRSCAGFDHGGNKAEAFSGHDLRNGCANDGVGVIIGKRLAGSDGRHQAGRPGCVGPPVIALLDFVFSVAADEIERRLIPWKSNA